MERRRMQVRTMLVRCLRAGSAITALNTHKSLYSMNIHEMASFLLSGL
ncbi:hypothetical protein ALO83_102709 [Pseudomonas cannabina pv. alisalensis]|uniref:Uncharacterized protein n=1 Tax=Pseudomonas cannabina TaxID=86840 RepID=A0A3M3RR40_PSECA|nr:hypothetical protein ALO83_102709 [Pseudomonas cannabina pv. alisalensis]RMN78641.1 hypothetical protein ALQ52_103267 [Pseudomonas cannabina pv. alisalensis]RMN83445.1 hypothetical protein ALQ53_102598 [Pseudomonas cannabina]RMN98907.1 hypothetical protein ALQ51_02049 [Pseudomonas cannabina]